jgi:RNA polymerase sigma-70 factor (ECF subfamily)
MGADPVGGRFVTTKWTQVVAAGDASDTRAREALAALCQTYWSPLYSYLRRHGHDREDAQDLVQGFFARLLERGDVRTADPARGRFRSFLLTALKRYAINEHERATSLKRGGAHPALSLDFDDAERRDAREPHTDDTPERVFDRRWAAISLDRAVQRLREECHQSGNGAQADALLPYLTDSGDLPAYAVSAQALGLSEGAVKVAVHRLRRRFGAILRLEIAETVLAPEDVEDEVRELIRVVSA